jgi:hypothetical protein
MLLYTHLPCNKIIWAIACQLNIYWATVLHNYTTTCACSTVLRHMHQQSNSFSNNAITEVTDKELCDNGVALIRKLQCAVT